MIYGQENAPSGGEEDVPQHVHMHGLQCAPANQRGQGEEEESEVQEVREQEPEAEGQRATRTEGLIIASSFSDIS